MDLKVNSVNFTGKKEVIYALVKAAQKAKDFEYYSQPAIVSRVTTNVFRAELKASMYAYLDMALRDEAFLKTVNEIKPSELDYLHVLLKPEQTQHSVIKPMNTFKQAMQYVIAAIGGSKTKVTKAANDLNKKLGL